MTLDEEFQSLRAQLDAANNRLADYIRKEASYQTMTIDAFVFRESKDATRHQILYTWVSRDQNLTEAEEALQEAVDRAREFERRLHRWEMWLYEQFGTVDRKVAEAHLKQLRLRDAIAPTLP